MSLAPRPQYANKHCLVPCQPEQCDCGKKQGRLDFETLSRLEALWAEERHRAKIEQLRNEDKTDEALALALALNP